MGYPPADRASHEQGVCPTGAGLNTQSLARVRESFAAMSPRIEAITARVYDLLFAARPDTRPLFKIDMAVQRRHLAAALGLLVRNLGVLDALQEPLRDLGARHARAGVRPDHYPAVVDAMLQAMAEHLADAWTADLAADWTALLLTVSRTMIAGTTGDEPDGVAAVNGKHGGRDHGTR